MIGAYALFTLLRLVLAHRISLPGWFLIVSIVFDMSLLFGLIWSFHLQYQQPASFYLKAPTLLYVFIFIALRALRFEARFVIAAGLAAAAGWLVLVLYVITVDPSDTMITRDGHVVNPRVCEALGIEPPAPQKPADESTGESTDDAADDRGGNSN